VNHFSYDAPSPGQDFKSGPLEYGADVLSVRSLHTIVGRFGLLNMHFQSSYFSSSCSCPAHFDAYFRT